jgi:molecular chaperone GrpE
MQPQNPAANGERGTGDKPVPGFTFADKRKVHPNTGGSVPAEASGQAAQAAGAGGGATPPGAHEAQAAELAQAEQLAAERLSDLQRLQAEYANYRKRVDRDRDVARESTVASIVGSLLPVLDDIHLARQHGDLETGPFLSIAEKLEGTLSRYGVERFGEPGVPFDPVVHDALMHVEEELAAGTEVTTVVGVLQPGYRIGDKIVRPARVSVADPPVERSTIAEAQAVDLPATNVPGTDVPGTDPPVVDVPATDPTATDPTATDPDSW